jgi:hypothetical protein
MPEYPEIRERRMYPRCRVDFVSEVYDGSEILFTTVVNLSEVGVGILLPKEFEEGSLFDLRIDYRLCESMLTKFERLNILIKAKLIWLKNIDGEFRGGLEIVTIESADLEKLRMHIRDVHPDARQKA